MLTIHSDLNIQHGSQLITARTSASGSLVFSFPDWQSLSDMVGMAKSAGLPLSRLKKRGKHIAQPVDLQVAGRDILTLHGGKITWLSVAHIIQLLKYIIFR